MNHDEEDALLAPDLTAGNKKAGAMDFWAGHRIGVRIFNLGITRSYLAERLGINILQLRRYMNGKNRMTVHRLWEIAEILRVHPGFFFEGSPALHVYDAVMPTEGLLSAVSPAGVELLDKFNLLSTSQKALVKGTIDAFLAGGAGEAQAEPPA